MSKDSVTISNNKMIAEFKKIFNHEYFTSECERLFGTDTPIGWFERNNNLFIINYEYYAKYKSRSLRQATKYYNIAKETEEFKKYTNCFLIVGYGTKPLKCEIYSTTTGDIKKIGDNLEYLKSIFDNNITSTDEILEDLKTVENMKIKFDPNIASKFNDYLHDNQIEISINKIFFVIIILLCRKYNPRILSYISKKDNGKVIFEYMSKLVKDNCRDKLFTESFDFMKYNLNTEHIYKLIKMLDFDIKFYESDILNQFYSEFMIYDKKGQSKDGIVLTPHDIVEIMIKELNIKKGESVMDCCTGTGSFLIEASKYTDNLIGCEKEDELYTAAKSNFILHDLNTDKLYYNNCFNQKFEMYDHIILNPPFSVHCGDNKKINDIYGWRNFDEEQKFIIYQLQYLKENGTGCFIIPRSNFNNTNQTTDEFKKILLDNCQILKIIDCNSNAFYPNANIQCTICIFKKCKPDKKYKTEIINYSDDGYITKNKIRYKISEPNIKSYKISLNFKDDWSFNELKYKESFDNLDIEFITQSLIHDEFKNKIAQYEAMHNYDEIFKTCRKYTDKLENIKIKELDKIIKVKLTDLLEYLQVKKYSSEEEPGFIPLYGATKEHLPIQFINNYSYDTSKAEDEITRENGVVMINNTGNGGAGLSFIQKGKFAVLGTVTLFKMKQAIDPINVYYIGEQLHKIYNRANSFSITKFNSQEVNYIIFKQ